MENPATWDRTTWVITDALSEAQRQQQEGIFGQSTAGIIHDALKTANLLAESEVEGLQRAVVVLRDYHEKHKMGVTAVIQSQWARGVSSGRGESINILEEEIRRLTSAQD